MTPYQQPGMAVPGAPGPIAGAGPQKPWMMTLILCLFGGWAGAHRFYVGKMGTGAAMLFTFGGCCFWQLFDLYLIFTGKFTDKWGQPLLKT
jgi:TM2 domain-containing membrane protein YozV